MKSIGILRTVCIFAFAVAMVLSCTDSGGSNGNEPENEVKESVGLTNDGHDVVVFQRGDLDEVLFKIDTVSITDTSFLGKLYFRNLPESKIPEPGDIISSFIAKKAPYGFLYRVVEVTKEDGDVTVVSVKYASIAEAVEEAEVEFTVPIGYGEEGVQTVFLEKCSIWNPSSYGECATNFLEDNIVGSIRTFVNTAEIVATGKGEVDLMNQSKEFSVNETITIPFDNSNISGNVKLNGYCKFLFKAKFEVKSWRLNYARISIAQNGDLDLEGNLNGKIEYEKNIGIINWNLPRIEFMIGPVPVVIVNKATLNAKVEVNAQTNMKANFNVWVDSEHGFKYENGEWSTIHNFDRNFLWNFKHSTFGSVRLGVLLGLQSLIYNDSGLELLVGPSAVLESPDLLSANSNTELKKDLDIDVKVHLFRLFELLDLSIVKDFGLAQIPWGNTFSDKTLPSFDFTLPSFDLSGIADGKLSFPFNLKRPDLGFSVEEYGFCIEDKEGECIKPGFGLGKLGKLTYSGYKTFVNFEGLTPGTYYNIIPYFKSYDGKIYYDTANALKNFISSCGGKSYDLKTQFCYSDKVYDKCECGYGGCKIYDPSIQFCANEDVGGDPIYEKIYNFCDGKSYDPKTQFCYYNYDYGEKQTVYDKCEGKGHYDPQTQFCFNNVLYDICGSKVYGKSYNPLTQFCYYGNVYDLCGDKSYIPPKFCFENELYDLCGNNSYIPPTQFCLDNAVYNKCGDKTYDPLVQFCLEDNTLHDLCGGNSYNPSTHFCYNKTAVYLKCGGMTYDLSKGEMCCNTIIFNTETQLCSNGGEVTNKTEDCVYDTQGNGYGCVKIGTQTWLNKNLNYDVPGSLCYDNDPINCKIYGRLYNWATAMNLPATCNTTSCSSQIKNSHQGICPDGWHIPNNADWDKLLRYVDGTNGTESPYSSETAGRYLKASSGWCYDNDCNGEDTYGFSALPGGDTHYYDNFFSLRSLGIFTSASEDSSKDYYHDIDDIYTSFAYHYYMSNWDIVYSSSLTKRNRYSVRCLKD